MSSHRFPAAAASVGLGPPAEITALDARYFGSVEEPQPPGLREALLTDWDRRALRLGDGVYPTLPSSTVRLIHALVEHGVERLAVVDDLDGVAEHWPATLVVDPAEADALLCSIPGHEGWLERLNTNLATGVPTLAARVRLPYDGWWQQQRSHSDIEVLHFRHDCDHFVTPGPLVLDGGGDHWLLRGMRDVAATGLPLHSYRDFYGLDVQRCHTDGLDALLERVDARLGRPVAIHRKREHEHGATVAHYFEDGHGFNAELRPDDRHLLLTFAPHDPQVETTVVSSVYECLGSQHTRTRPQRTSWTPSEMIF